MKKITKLLTQSVATLGLLAHGLFAQEPQAGWPVVSPPPGGPWAFHSMSMGDLDSDGLLEVIGYQIAQCRSWAFDGDGSHIASWLFTPGTMFCPGTQEFLHIGDITGDGVPEVLFLGSSENHVLFALDRFGQGIPGWPVVVGGPGAVGHEIGRVVLADLNGDDVLEVIVQDRGFGYASKLWVYDGQGNVLPGWPVDFDLLLAGLAVGDLEFDGVPEIVVSIADGFDPWIGPQPIYVLGPDGAVRDGWPVTIVGGDGPRVLINVTIADLDGDYSCEIFGTGPDAFYALDASGELRFWMFNFPYVVPPAVGDLDGDGTLEILVPSNGLTLMSSEGSIMAQIPGDAAYTFYNGLNIGDLDGDGVCEIGARSIAPPAMCWFDSELEPLPGWPRPISPGAATPPRYVIGLTDLDGDGDLESIYPNDGVIEAWDFPNPNGPTRVEWGSYYHDPQRTGFYHSNNYPGPRFLRGDVDVNGTIDLGDACQGLRYLFQGIAHSCPARIDFDGDAVVDICDVVSQLQYTFLGGPPPSAPFPNCREVKGEPLPCARQACP
ncbi:MAG: hypothetical protein ACKVX7_17265 [Planctomycetota bacterium]